MDAQPDALRAQVRAAIGPTDPRAAAAVLERRMRWFVVIQVAYLGVLLTCPFRPLEVLAAALFGLYRVRTLWTIVHDRIHQPPLPLTPARLIYDVCIGFVAQFWRKEHLAHHAHTNTARDPDVHLYFGRTLGQRGPVRGVPRALSWLTTVAQLPLIFVLIFLRSMRFHAAGKIALFVLGLLAFPLALRLVLSPEDALLNSVAVLGLGSLYVLVTFAPTHAASEANFVLSGDRQHDALVASNDVWPHSRLWSWLCGGINLHIEHHLFPSVPSQDLPRIAPIVRSWALARGLPYNAWSLGGLWWAHLAFLWRAHLPKGAYGREESAL